MERISSASDFELKKLPNPQGNLKHQEAKRVNYDRITILLEATNESEIQPIPKHTHKTNHTLDSDPKLACQQCGLI